MLEQDIASSEGTELHLGDPEAPLLLAVRGGSVFSMPGMLATMVFVGMTQAVAEALADEDDWYAWDAFRRFLVSFSAAVWGFDLEGLDLELHVEHARPAEYLPDLAQRVGADLVVMGTVAHTGIPGFFIGNTAERILSRLTCSALTVKPTGFITPVA